MMPTPLATGRGVCSAWLVLSLGLALSGVAAGASRFTTFESGQVRPLALSPDGTRLFAANTPDGRLEIFGISSAGLEHRGSVAVGLEPVAVAARTAGEVWVVNHLSDSVSIVDVSAVPPRVVRTLLVGDEPRDIVFAGPNRSRAFITTAHRGQNRPGDPELTTPGVGRADVWVFDATDAGPGLGGTPITIVSLFGDTPRALAASPDGGTVYAAVFHSGNQTTVVPEGAVCNGGALAPPCSVGGFLMPGGLPAPNTDRNGIPQPEVGLIVKWNAATGHWEDELGRSWNNAIRFSLPDLDVFAIDANAPVPAEIAAFPHVGTMLFNMAVNPVSGKVYVSNTEARNEVRFEGPGEFFGSTTVRGHLHEARITILDGATVIPRHLNKHLDYRVVPTPEPDKQRSLATPLDMAVTADGTTLYVAAFGSSRVGVFATAALEADTFVPAAASHIPVSGGGPSGLVLDEARNRLYVLTRFDNGISVIDTAAKTEVAHLALYNPEPPAVQLGRPLLYDAVRTSSNGEASCAACHVFGDLDSLAWDLGNPDDEVLPNLNPFTVPNQLGFSFPNHHPLKGPMTTQSLRGMANHGPMHWRGDRSGGNDPGGEPLDEAAAFFRFIGAFEGLLGRDGPIPDADMRRFTDFILQVSYPPNPIRALDNSLTPEQQAGRDKFFSPQPSDVFQNCDGCHRLDPQAGFFGSDGFSSFEFETQLFKIPHLRNLYQKIGMFGMAAVPFFNPGDNGHKGPQIRGFGFLHDGSTDTLFRFHQATVFNRTNPGGLPLSNPDGFPAGPAGDVQRRAMEQFMLAFDSNLAPIVGQQITLASGNAAVVASRLDLLAARAAAGECDLVVRGTWDGVERGAFRLPSGRYRSDRALEPLRTEAEMQALAAVPGQELTWTCVPPGEGLRRGIDRDDDGAFDRDELDAGSDPADPTSRPAGVGMRLVRTTRLLLAERQDRRRGPRIVFRSFTGRDAQANRIVPPPGGDVGDPTLLGATLSVYNGAGLASDAVVVDLPASRWSARRRGYRYRDPQGPIRSVVLRPDLLVVRGGGSAWGYTLDEPRQGRIAVRLDLTSRTLCAEAPARSRGNPPSTEASDRPGRFIAARPSPPPASCPPVPAGSPSGAFVEPPER